MNKRIISLILAFLMLSTFLFTGCDALMGGEETEPGSGMIDEASNSAMTLSMFVVCVSLLRVICTRVRPVSWTIVSISTLLVLRRAN